MKKIYLIIAFSLISLISIRAFGFQEGSKIDTNAVQKLVDMAYDSRLENPQRTVLLAEQAIQLAEKLEYPNGLAAAYRVKGIGFSYLSNYSDAYNNYYQAIKNFRLAKNKIGEAKVNMNIGNLYREDSYDKALMYYKKSLPVALKFNDTNMIASLSLNMGNVYLRQKKYDEALAGFIKGKELFEKLGDKKNVINCIQNTGGIYYNLQQYDKAEVLLLQARTGAKANDMKINLAGIGLTLSEIYIAKEDYNKAQKFIEEGLSYAESPKSKHDFNYLSYQLELKRKNYAKAVDILAAVYRADSTENKNSVEQQIEIIDKTNNLKDSAVTIAEQKNTRSIAIGIGVAAILLVAVIVLLMANVRRKTETNKQLTDLNAEVSRQKENVDRINRHLEEIIDERTKDLQIKNKKLAEHSSYLSHQIRGPIATLKGLMNLEKEGLVEQQECIDMMNKCVSEIDDKIIDMSDMLHNPGRSGL